MENTLPALKEAFRQQVDGVEFDVRLTADNVPIVFHDRDLNDLTNGKGRVRHTLFEDVRKLHVYNKKNKALSKNDPIIPTLAEVLDAIEPELSLYHRKHKRAFKVNIEIKGKEAPWVVIDEVVQRLKSSKWREDNFHISGFKLDRLQVIRDRLPNIEMGALYVQNLGERMGYRKVYGLLDRVFKEMEKIRPYSLNLPIEYYAKPDIAKRIRKEGYEPIAWTYQEKMPEMIQKQELKQQTDRILEDKITIITDFPAKMRAALEKASS